MDAVIGGKRLDPAQALERLSAARHLICHSAFFIERLGVAAQVRKLSPACATSAITTSRTLRLHLPPASPRRHPGLPVCWR
jgi:hypothetical protein